MRAWWSQDCRCSILAVFIMSPISRFRKYKLPISSHFSFGGRPASELLILGAQCQQLLHRCRESNKLWTSPSMQWSNNSYSMGWFLRDPSPMKCPSSMTLEGLSVIWVLEPPILGPASHPAKLDEWTIAQTWLYSQWIVVKSPYSCSNAQCFHWVPNQRINHSKVCTLWIVWVHQMCIGQNPNTLNQSS